MALFPSFLWLSTIPLSICTTSFFFFGCAGSFLQCVVFFSCGAQAVEHAGSVVVSHGLSCPEACRILVTWPGMEPGSPASEGIFSTTGLPGKSQHHIFFIHSSVCGHLGSFRILVIMNSAAMSIGAHLSFRIIIFFWIYAQEWDCWSVLQLYFYFFEEPPYCFAWWLHQFMSPPTATKDFWERSTLALTLL